MRVEASVLPCERCTPGTVGTIEMATGAKYVLPTTLDKLPRAYPFGPTGTVVVNKNQFRCTYRRSLLGPSAPTELVPRWAINASKLINEVIIMQEVTYG